MWDTEETICAIASPAGPAARAAIRISGPDCLLIILGLLPIEVADRVSRSKRASCYLTEIDLEGQLGKVDCRVFIWPTEKSYTGQPSAELHLIGAAPLLQAVLDRLHAQGARLARPGEFTLRAFLAGRLDLTQAEAVLGVIDADTRTGLGAALDQLTGGISQPLMQLREAMIALLADVEAGLDFVDEDIQFIADDQLVQRLEEMASLVEQAAVRMQSGSRSGDAPLIVLCGKPNAGKSRLLNRLAGFESAIVSSVVGTTRDPVEVRMQLGKLTVRVVDTAGVERLKLDDSAANGEHFAASTSDSESIEGQAQMLGRSLVEDADLRIWCSTLESPLEQPPIDWINRWPNHWLMVATKSDLVPNEVHEAALAEDWLVISSVSGQGVEDLITQIEQRFEVDDEGTTVAATAARCRATLVEAAAGLASAAEVASTGAGHELVSAELRFAIDAIGQVTGMVYTDDILDSIFSRFCIGK